MGYYIDCVIHRRRTRRNRDYRYPIKKKTHQFASSKDWSVTHIGVRIVHSTKRLWAINPELELTKLALEIDEMTSHQGHIIKQPPAAGLLLRRLIDSFPIPVKFDGPWFTLDS